MVGNNTAVAMVLSRLFTGLIGKGVVVVTTSNRPPKDLYKDGLNREHFLPFIALIEARLDVVSLNGPTDYRLDRLGGFPTYYTPHGQAANRSEEHTSELQSIMRISYAVFCLQTK